MKSLMTLKDEVIDHISYFTEIIVINNSVFIRWVCGDDNIVNSYTFSIISKAGNVYKCQCENYIEAFNRPIHNQETEVYNSF